MSSLRDILHRLDSLSESGEFAGHYKTGPAGQLKAQDHVGPDGARGRLVGDSVEPRQDAVKEYMPMPEPLTDDTVMELSAETLAAYRAAALKDKQFNLRGIAQANRMAQEKERQGDLSAVDDWQDEAQFFRSVNAKRNRGIARADRSMAKASEAGSDVAEGTQKKSNATTRHLRDYPVSDKDVAKPVKKPEKKKPEQGVAEMDKSQPSHGRDGKISHSTYGSRDKKGYFKGKEAPGKAITAKQASKDALDILKKQGVAEGTKTATEDVVSRDGKNLGDYLQDVAKIIKKDPELLDRVAQELDKLGPAVKTLHTDDGHEIKIHGNEDDGFRISIKNKTAKGRFRDLDEARMAVELFVARRRKHSQDNSDYVDEK